MVTVAVLPATAFGVEIGKENRKHTVCELAGVINWFDTCSAVNVLEGAISVPVLKLAAVQLVASAIFQVSTMIASTKGAPAPVGRTVEIAYLKSREPAFVKFIERKNTSPGFRLESATTFVPLAVMSTQPEETSILAVSVSVNIAPEAAVTTPKPAVMTVAKEIPNRTKWRRTDVLVFGVVSMHTLKQFSTPYLPCFGTRLEVPRYLARRWGRTT